MKKRITLTILAFLVWGLLGCLPEDHEADTQKPRQGHEGEVHLSEAQLEELGIEVKAAGPATLVLELSLPGEIVVNADQVAHLSERVRRAWRYGAPESKKAVSLAAPVANNQPHAPGALSCYLTPAASVAGAFVLLLGQAGHH